MSLSMQDQVVSINGRLVGHRQPPYIVAEMSGNHNGDLTRALRIIDAAKVAGADAIKIQTYRADTITIDHGGANFVIEGGLWHGLRLYDLYAQAFTPWEWHKPIFDHARDLGLTIFSSPFDSTAVDLLEQLDAPAYKIASPEIIDLPLIRRVAQTKKPIIISTGMATLDEIAEAVDAARGAGAREIAVLHCTSAYPTPPEEANLSTIAAIADRFRVVAGLSDHTLGTVIPTIAVALGAAIIEKHFTLSRAEGGVDAAFSLEPAELAELVTAARIAAVSIGAPAFHPTRTEQTIVRIRRSLYVVAPVAKGELLTRENVRSIRPGDGLKPKFLDAVIGRRAARDLAFGEPLLPSMVEGLTLDENR